MSTEDRLIPFARQWARYIDNPPLMAVERFGFQPTPYQAAVMLAVAAGRDVSWRAGHGVGKTATLALLVFWFLLTRPFSKVPTTAPTFRQVKDILWSEIAMWYERFDYRSGLRLDTTRLSVRGFEREWFATGVASNRPQNIEGFHAKHILFIGDEAKGIPDPIFDAIDGALTTGGQRLYSSTPGSRRGRFYETHFGTRARYFEALHTNGEHSERVNRAWLEQKREEWGVDSAIYLAKIRGEFPAEGDDVLIPVSYLDAAHEAYEEVHPETGALAVPLGPHAVLGCDVARHGLNDTVAAYGDVKRIEWIHVVPKGELYESAAWLRLRRQGWPYEYLDREGSAFGDLQETRAELIGVDDTGVGGGVTSDLRRDNVPCLPVTFGGSPVDAVHYANVKTEAAFALRAALMANARARREGQASTFALCPHDKADGQLSNLRVRPVSGAGSGRVRILDPDDPSIEASEIPKGLRISPDHAHAVLICHYTATRGAMAGAGVIVPASAAGPGLRSTPADRGEGPTRPSQYVFRRRPSFTRSR